MPFGYCPTQANPIINFARRNSTKILGDVYLVARGSFNLDPDAFVPPVRLEYVFSMPRAVHPSTDRPFCDLLGGVPVVVGDAILPCHGIIEMAEGDILGSDINETSNADFTSVPALPITVGKAFSFGTIVA